MFGRHKTPRKTSRTPDRKQAGVLVYGQQNTASDKEKAEDRRNRPAAKPAAGKNVSRETSWDWGRIRLWTVGIFFFLIWGALWTRAYHLQITMGPEYAALAKRQHTISEQLTGVRGHIMDRNGNVLARSVESSSVAANPAQIQDKQQAAIVLAEALNLPVSRVLAQLQEKRQFVWLARKIDYHRAENIRALNIPGVFLRTEYERVYPYRHLAGQLLGFVDIDDKGIEGLEKAFENDLSGRRATRAVERDARGNRLMVSESGSLADLRGRNIRLTLDAQIQFFAEEALAESVTMFGARWGGCIVVDVPTGEILAWAQYPFFNPNNINATPQADRRNRLAGDMLEQGSTIKSFLIAAALEEEVVQASTMINCENGRWRLRNAMLHDVRPHGMLSVERIMSVSSNIGVAKIGLMLGAETYRSYLSRLGFGERTGLPLVGEARGILRPPSQWSEIDIAAASFGQSFSATMVQMAQAYLSLASDGIRRPLHLVMDQGREYPPDFSGKRIFSEATMGKVRSMLRKAVEEEGGTGRHARIPGLVMGGKTGTAQKADKSGRYGDGRVGSFVGMVPIEEPRYLILVLLDEPSTVQYGGVIAAPVFRHVALNVMAYHGLLPDSDDPMVREVARKEAERKQAATAKRPKNDYMPAGQNAGRAFTIAETAPAEARIAAASAHTAAKHASSIVPVVTGMGLRNAVEIFAAEGVVPIIKGRGNFVVRQTPEPGSPWPDGTRESILWLEDRSS